MAICRKPYYTRTSDIAPCGLCPECRVNRKQLWTNRNILESFGHKKKCFVTLTYAEENLPKNADKIPTLHKPDLQNFIRKIRDNSSEKVRYYAVGEYGTAGDRGINPHYHALLYGLDETDAKLINDSWRSSEGRGKTGKNLGFTYVDDLNPQTIAYVVGYVEKKTIENRQRWDYLNIIPEYSTMSLKPTIGFSAVEKLVTLFRDNPQYLTEFGDVPYSIKHGKRSLPLGNYIREKVREGLNLPHDTKTFVDTETGLITERKIWHGKENYKEQKKLEMQALQNSQDYDKKLPPDARVSQKHLYQYLNAQAHLNFDSKTRLKRNKHTL